MYSKNVDVFFVENICQSSIDETSNQRKHWYTNETNAMECHIKYVIGGI